MAVALLAASSWALGTAALRRLPWPELCPYERAALRLTAGLGLTALLLSLAGLAGWFTAGVVLVCALAVAGIVMLALRPPAFSFSALAVVALLPCLGAMAPVTDDDALAYVIPIARRIAATGVVRVWSDQARAMWPQSQEVLLACMIRLGGDRLGALTALEFLLGIGVLSALARRVCERSEHAWTAVVLALGAPVVAFQVSSAKEDLLVLAAAAAAAFCLAGDESAAAGLFAGIAAGAKYPGALIAAAAVLWPLLHKRVRAAAVVALCAAASGGLWYARNWWTFGNPAAPFVFGARGTPLDAQAMRDYAHHAAHGIVGFIAAPAWIFAQPSPFGGRANLFNPLVYAGLVGLLITSARRRSGPLFFLAAALYAGWFMALQNARLLLPAAALLAPAAADRLGPLMRRTRTTAAVAVLSFAIVVAVGVIRFERYARDPAGFLDRETQNYADMQWMNAHLDRRRDRVATLDHKALANLEIPWINLETTYQTEISENDLRDPQRFLLACRRQGITHIFGDAARFPNLRPIYRNPSSLRGGTRFFRQPPTEETAVWEVDSRKGGL